MTTPLKTRLNILNVKLEKALGRKGPRIPGDGDGDGIPNEGKKKGGAAPARAANPKDDEAAALASRPKMVEAYRSAAKLSSEKGQKALDVGNPALESKDAKQVKAAITVVTDGMNAHKASYAAALKIPYPGNSSPWKHHEERAKALGDLASRLQGRLKALTVK